MTDVQKNNRVPILDHQLSFRKAAFLGEFYIRPEESAGEFVGTWTGASGVVVVSLIIIHFHY